MSGWVRVQKAAASGCDTQTPQCGGGSAANALLVCMWTVCVFFIVVNAVAQCGFVLYVSVYLSVCVCV